MRIEFGKSKFGETAKKNILHSLESCWVIMGPKVAEFEEKWGKLFDYKYNVAMSSGTDADINACTSLYDFDARRGDEIIAPALAFIAVGEAILAAGFKPVFVDVKRETLNINTEKIEENITSKTKAILAVHTMGKPCDMTYIMEIAKKHNLMVIEDSCEAHGAMYKDKFVGHYGDMSTFSFFAAHLICTAEGGMVSTNNKDIAEILKSTRTHGRFGGSTYFDHVRIGYNSKMNDLEASLGLEAVEEFWNIFNKRKKNLLYLMEQTKELNEFAFFNMEEPHEKICPHAFTLTLKDPKLNYKNLYGYLEENSIHCKRNFGSIPTQHKAYEYLGYKLGDFPEAEYIGDNGLHIGVHQHLSKDDLDYVAEVLKNYFKKV